MGRSGGPRRPHATRRLGGRARDRRLERRRAPHRQTDREPLARGDQDGDGRGSDGARSQGCARSRAGGLQARADARACGGDQRPAHRASRATIVARAACSKRLTLRRPIPISPRPICASVTAIPPRIGWPALERLRAWRHSISNRRSRWGALRLTRMTCPPRAQRSPRSSPRIPSNGRPTRRVCLLMADIEETEGNHGAVREWLGRAARAPRDKAWVADGVISDRWAPVSPSGTLDGFVWRTPDERIAAPMEHAPPPPPPPTASDRRAHSSASGYASARGDRAGADAGARADANHRSRAANGRHHRSHIDVARRSGPSGARGARSQTARLPAVRQ